MTGKGKHTNEGETKTRVQKLYGKQPADLLLQHQSARQDCGAFGAAKQSQMGAMPSCIEYQGARDRITYHELMAQSKIQTLRVKLFARLRTFDEITEKWGMRVIELPSKPSDWWHARLHFISRD